jgi:PAT family beta-lactamase induction signal transducer AmpG
MMDRFSLYKHFRRKSWMIFTQVLLLFAILMISTLDPTKQMLALTLVAFLIAFFSASQDIVLDAWRREAVPAEDFGWGTSIFVSGYLFSMRMLSGAGALILSDFLPWSEVYLIMAGVQSLGLVATLVAAEPRVESQPRTLRETVIEPFVDYLARPGAILLLLFILLYKAGDVMAAHMTIPFYLDLGFSRAEVGAISKLVGWASVFFGTLIGGILMARISLGKALFIFGILQGVSTFGFAVLALIGKSTSMLTGVIVFENLTAGMGTASFVAFMGLLTNRKFTATQYALLTSLMGIPRSILAAPTGYMAQVMGWFSFFGVCTLVAVPGLMMILYFKKRGLIPKA